MSTQPFGEIWVYLSASPLLGLTVTLLAYQAAHALYRRSGAHPLANPVLVAVAILVGLLQLTATSYETYFAGAQFVHFLLGPATVALAVPLYTQFRRVRSLLLPISAGLLAGSATAIASAVLIARLLDASPATQASLAPKSVTTPIAMGIAERIGGLPSLTAVLVICTGVLGAIAGGKVLSLARVHDPAVRGFALGVAAHGIGTARAFQVSEQTGAFAALAMGLNGLLTALLLPAIAGWLVK
ncbi:LrgB family protein [Azonexus fungiphilus]|uniref:LrgB family protein n=1 Tax=Azonexus fungiphilus TaxID=146940 RepID=UPI00156AD880|nr:LrgB family protein [Azonexus fungiphilus]NHC06061.1 LrgB family protein [Azonexus fungiphilus]